MGAWRRETSASDLRGCNGVAGGPPGAARGLRVSVVTMPTDALEPPVETNATCMRALLVGLPDIDVLGVEDEAGQPLRVHVETIAEVTGCLATIRPATPS